MKTRPDTDLDTLTNVLAFRDGRWVRVWSDGTVLPEVSGGAPDPDPDPKGDPDDDKGDKGGKTFTQAELDEKVRRRVREEQERNDRKIADALGVPLDEAKKLIEERKEAEKAALGEAERAKVEAAEARKAADTERAEALKEKLAARIEKHLLRAGVNPDDVESVGRMLAVAEDADDEAVKDAVGDLKKNERFAPLFAASTGEEDPDPKGDKKDPPKGSNLPGKTPPKQKTDRTAFDVGADRAKKLNESRGIGRSIVGAGAGITGNDPG